MTFEPSRGRLARQRAGRLSGLRKLFRLIRTIDLAELGQMVEKFDARQTRLEQSQRQIEAFLLESRARIEAAFQLPNQRTAMAGILDIKNLGYELGRVLAEKNLVDQPVKIDHAALKSKLCTQADFSADWLLYWCREMATVPYYHRKIWELSYVAQAIFAAGQLAPGRRGLGFGCGEEPLPSVFAKHGARVLATDLDPARPEAEVWRLTDQHAGALETIRRPDLCPDPQLLANIEYRPVDMTDIPRDLDGQFDFCWSACALEHLGSLATGLEFIENSLRTLKPGGIAVHTTEFTVNDGETIDNHPIVLYQRRHFEELANRVEAVGFTVAEFDFDPGDGILDRFVDLPPFADGVLISSPHYAHLKLLFDGYTCTSAGMIIRA